jgi:hypothetical protein
MPVAATSVGGSSATLATENSLMILRNLVDVDETHGVHHQEVDLVEQNAVCESSESMSRRICRASSGSPASILLRIMKLTAPRVIIMLRSNAPVQILVVRNSAQYFAASASVTSPDSTCATCSGR